jgi:putative membrane protein
VLLAKYQSVLEAVNSRDFFTLFLVAIGAGFGLIAFSRLLNWLLKRHHDMTLAILTGLMVGSLRKIWPWKKTLESMTDAHGNILPIVQTNVLPSHWNNEVMIALFLMVIGLLVVFFLNLWAMKKTTN